MRDGASRTKSDYSNSRTHSLTTILLASAAFYFAADVGMPRPAHAQDIASQTLPLNIRSQDLGLALATFADRAGVKLLIPSSLVAGKTSPTLSGNYTREQALGRLLAGTGLNYNFTNAGTVTIYNGSAGASAQGAPIDASDSTLLDTITVSGRNGADPADAPYQTAGSSTYISGEQIDRYKGTNASDILRNDPGIFSGESRNSAGMDVNIRGMQGQGRVAVTVDGAQNSTAIYRGYQGISNSTYVDPDFIGGITIQKGPASGATGAGAIGGSVAMRTVGVDDIIPEGKNFGGRFKIEGGTNTTSPWSEPYKVPGRAGKLERPGLLDIKSGSASVLLGARTENVDLLAGIARRNYGNYHAGAQGSSAPQPIACNPAADPTCQPGRYTPGLTAYLPGEEVLNTSQDTYSTLLKGTFRFADDHKLDLGYSRYDSVYGETLPSTAWNNGMASGQNLPSHIKLDSYTARYNWNPESDLIDLKLNVWRTDLDETSRSATYTLAEKWGRMYGTDISNTSRLDTPLGGLSLKYGAAYLYEETGPDRSQYVEVPPREGKRKQTSAFADAKWSPFDWLDVDGGLRWQKFRTQDTRPPASVWPVGSPTTIGANTWDYSFGVTVKPMDGLQLYGTYKNASRLPSLFESAGGFMTKIDPNLQPEQAKTWEVGANFMRDGVFANDDKIRLKAGYFDNTVDDYINRRWSNYIMNMSNIARAHFSGVDLSARYEIGGFSAELAGIYYTDVEFCRTMETCKNSSLAADYATNQIPPKYSASLTLAQKLLDDKLTFSTRISYVGPRSADAEPTGSGANPFIAPIPWKPYTLVDVFAAYRPTDSVSVNLSIENLFDTYYVNPMSLALLPSPGRTIRLGVTGDLSEGTLAGLGDLGVKAGYDWTGLYVGAHGQFAMSKAMAHEFSTNGGWGADYRLPQIDGAGFGAQAGYNHHFANNFVLGLEGSFSSFDLSRSSPLSENSTTNIVSTEMDWTASARVRAGFAVDRFMVYGLAGYTVAGLSGSYLPANDVDKITQKGWTFGGGIEFGLTDRLSLTGEYSFTRLDGNPFSVNNGTSTWEWKPDLALDEVRLGINYRF